MIRICKRNQESVLSKVRSGKLDALSISVSNLVDDVILAMHHNKILQCLGNGISDRRADNTVIPFNLVFAFAVAAKMKIRTSLTDIPFAITDHRVLAELGYTIRDDGGNLDSGLMTEGALRFLIGKYEDFELFDFYNRVVQQLIFPKLDITPNIHILDCTKIEVNLNNEHYEGSTIGLDKDGNPSRGYKLSTLRGIVGDTGIIEDIRFGNISTHDLNLSLDMMLYSPVLKEGDILINDRGFLSREIINQLKLVRKVDTYVPLRKNMDIYTAAVGAAKIQNAWFNHPYRNNQRITLIKNLGCYWQNKDDENVELNACVVWDVEENMYFTFVTTDLSKSAKQIIQMYELRPEIEEDYRQLKDFWKLEDFKSTKLKVIAFHIVCLLFGYLFFQLYTILPDGDKYLGKSLPVVLKNYQNQVNGTMILYVGFEFAIVSLIDLMDIYADCEDSIKQKLKAIIGG